MALLLVCFDGSEAAASAIGAAATLMPGHEAVVLTVAVQARVELGINPLGDAVGRLSGLYREWDEAASEVAEQEARRGCELAGGAGLRPRPLVAHGKPAPTILRVADEHDVAAIVLGAGRHPHGAGLLGGVSLRVVQHAERPVLVVPAPPSGR
jgi:nucleotide-binding universal stress UspA family protein